MEPVTGQPTDGPHRIGVIGVGHWAAQFEEVTDGGITFYRAADVVPYQDKQGTLDALDIPEPNYVDISDVGDIPSSFYDGVDIVQVASPIEYHEEQTLNALNRSDATVVVEKAPGPTRASIDPVRDASADRDAASYPHLHYIRKQPSIALQDDLPAAVAEHGPVESVEATFLEAYDRADADRDWIFTPENGGIMLDWIHPLEVLVWATDATFTALRDATGYLTEPEYVDRFEADHPTAARATFDVDGELYDDATATVRVGKGFEDTVKAMRFELADGTLDLRYAGSGTERTTSYRGHIRLHGDDDETFNPVLFPSGGTPYELMGEDMVRAVETGAVPVTWTQADEMLAAVDAVNAEIHDDEPVADDLAIDELWQDAVDSVR